jgi:3-dehydroquinate synthase II
LKKKIILKYDKVIKEKNFNELFQASLNHGVFDIFTDETFIKQIKTVKRIKIYTENIDLNPSFLILDNPSDEELSKKLLQADKSNFLIGCRYEVSSKVDEKKIINAVKRNRNISFIIIKTTDWKVIPFENLIAALSTEDISLYSEVNSIEEANLLLNTLEIGVDGIIYRPTNVNDILDLKNIVGVDMKINLTTAKIIGIKNIAKADRVCVDTSSILHPGEGMLVGSTAKGFLLVHAEVFETEFVNSRPFRVNAGDVSAYIIVPERNEFGELKTRTNYLSELKAGDDVIITNVKGITRIVTVGRVKIETRPMILFKLEADAVDKDGKQNKKIPVNIILQNAETIRVVKKDNNPISVVDLKIGDEVIIYLGPGATHFGTTIKENIIEK